MSRVSDTVLSVVVGNCILAFKRLQLKISSYLSLMVSADRYKRVKAVHRVIECIH